MMATEGKQKRSRHNEQEEAWLLGQPALEDYLDFVREMTVGGAEAHTATLIDEWCRANDYYHELETSEANAADLIRCRKLPKALQPLAEAVRSDPRYKKTFDAVPTSFELVELDRLILFQKHVTWTFVEGLSKQLGNSPEPAAVFEFCMPLGEPVAQPRVRQLGSRRFVFSSDSKDFRFHEPVVLRPEQVRDYTSFGAIGGVLGLVVGFSSNLMSAVRSDNRLILHNGYHRACALRALGVTHAPCIVETVTRRDELNIVAKRRVAEDPAFYLRAARPPMLKDFFDPKIRKVLPVHKATRMIEVSFKVRDLTLPE